MREDVEALLRRWLPGCDLDIRRATSGGSTEVYRVESGGTVAWLRLAEDPGEDRSVEYAVHDRLRAMGARMPEILIAEAAPPELDRSAALTGTISGVALSECRDPVIAERVAREAASDLARINEIEVRGYGWIDRLDRESGAITAERPARDAWTREYRAALEKLLAGDLIPGHLRESLHQYVTGWADSSDWQTESRLAHGDFDTTHIYFDPEQGTYTGIIDLGEARGTDIEYDLGHLLLHDGEGDRPAIYSAVVREWAGGEVDWKINRNSHVNALAIGIRQIARQLDRGDNPYLNWLLRRVIEIMSAGYPHTG